MTFKISGPVMVSFIEYGMMAIFDLAMLCYAGEIIKAEVSFCLKIITFDKLVPITPENFVF